MESGDEKEHQRVLAIIEELRKDRIRLDARLMLPSGPTLESDLDAYQLGALDAISSFEPDPIERLTHFNDRLALVRLPLMESFDDVIASQRARRAQLRSATNLSRSAQWTLLLGSVIGVMLAIGLCVTALRQMSAPADRAVPISSSQTSLRRAAFDVTELVEECLAPRRSYATRSGLLLKFEPQPGAMVLCDREQIREVLEDLLDVAIADGRLSSELILRVGNSDGDVRVTIIDPGPRGEPSRADPIAILLLRQIVEAQGGKLGVQSSAISRTYWFTLPSEPALLR